MPKPKHSAVEAPVQADFPDLKLPVPDIAEVKALRSSAKKLGQLVLQRQALKSKIKALEAQAKEFDAQILPILFRADVQAVKIDGRSIRIMETPRQTLSKMKLIEAGVSPQTIIDCTETTTTGPYIRVDESRSVE